MTASKNDKPKSREIQEKDLKPLAWAAYIVMGVLALVISLQDPSILRAAYAKSDAHRAAMDRCSVEAKQKIHTRMEEGEFTVYGSFIRMPGVQLRCLWREGDSPKA
ncbi:hypothetical protein [Cohaesibacter gelatinilyticus]|uniref:Uncharacterized protein n=1 Tax=Cohaesibacter gelatinilyticus TaxID=372072 RepID=A0A285NCL9_9HYPH|nr:hypothetical protein [Cohaesibacter gelatinilyticus]SNZ07264.1 hypothetical protein SAMN06265368_0781 [Cohaesibacter gelatinilyticus]